MSSRHVRARPRRRAPRLRVARITTISSLRERRQLDHRAPREERRVDLEVRVLRRRPDERDEPVLDRVQDGVLLRLVEAVDLVDEEDRPEAVAAQPVARARDDGADVVDACRDGRDLLERGSRSLRDDPGDRRLPRARRAEEDHRRRTVLLDREPERGAGPEDVLLAHELVEIRRPQPHRERERSRPDARAPPR